MQLIVATDALDVREVSFEAQLNTLKARADLLQDEVDDSRGRLALVMATKNSLETQLKQAQKDLQDSQASKQQSWTRSEELDARRKNDLYETKQLRGKAGKFEIEAFINLDHSMAAEKKLEEAGTEFARQKAKLEAVRAREKARHL